MTTGSFLLPSLTESIFLGSYSSFSVTKGSIWTDASALPHFPHKLLCFFFMNVNLVELLLCTRLSGVSFPFLVALT